jgi:hypothetical protein
MATGPRRSWNRRGRRWLRNLVWAGATFLPVVATPALADPPRTLPASVTADAAGQRVVAYVYGEVPVTRAELGEYLIARGGMDKLELLVNKRVIEVEAARRGISVTPLEIASGLEEDLRGAGPEVNKAAFTQFLRDRYGKTLYEWEQDVIRPRLLLGKMSRQQVSVSPEEVQRAFESKYGEKREPQIIVWPKNVKGLQELPQDVKDIARTKPEEFEKLAAKQPDKRFADVNGRVAPIGRHIDGEDPRVEAALFSLKEGEISEWIETPTAWTCVRCLKIIPPDPGVKLDERIRDELEKELFDKKLSAEIPKTFAELKKVATPVLTSNVPLPPQYDPQNPPPRVPVADPRVLAFVYGDKPITREDLGEFLIARGGYEKLELFVNRRIIEMEAAKRHTGLSPEEVEAAKKESVNKLGIANLTMDDFVKHVLPKQKLTLFSWTEDVIKPELVLAKMCKDRVTVTPEDLQHAFESEYGEKRLAKIVLWKKEDFRTAQKQWGEARAGDEAFDRIARGQFTVELAAAAGQVAPIGRHLDANNPLIEKVVFSLQVGEVSQLFDTPAGVMCIKCVGIVPPVAGMTLDAVRDKLTREVYDRKLAKEIPALFAELKKKANPDLLLKGPPTQRDTEEGIRDLVRQVGAVEPPKKK